MIGVKSRSFFAAVVFLVPLLHQAIAAPTAVGDDILVRRAPPGPVLPPPTQPAADLSAATLSATNLPATGAAPIPPPPPGFPPATASQPGNPQQSSTTVSVSFGPDTGYQQPNQPGATGAYDSTGSPPLVPPPVQPPSLIAPIIPVTPDELALTKSRWRSGTAAIPATVKTAAGNLVTAASNVAQGAGARIAGFAEAATDPLPALTTQREKRRSNSAPPVLVTVNNQ